MPRPDGTVAFCVGTGRCGTTFITELLGLEPEIAASHERLRLAACYHMFCKWHGIPSDAEGFLVDRDLVVANDLATRRISFEASALLSHSIAELHERFDARFLLLVRRPDACVASFAVRGWFLEPIAWRDRSKPPSIPDAANPRHFFGRNLPRGDHEFERWSQLTQLGKLGWFWAARNRAILDQFAALPPTRRSWLRLEDFDYARYVALGTFLGYRPTIDAARFAQLADSRPNTGPNRPLALEAWSEQGSREFEAEVAPVAEALGYEYRIAALAAGASPLARPARDLTDVLAAL
ncbi:MAG: hypothetical protein H0V17_16485 [Deltaproteobacteria bacterium]|nr:hypothetical protein [Deltaproteobacteria bacterium]